MSPAQVGRSTATISVSQTAPIRIHHLTESLCLDERTLRRWLPEVAGEALDLCSRPTADAAQFERTLARDPALAAQVISIAGAGLFAPRVSVMTPREAVLHLGLESMRDVLFMIVSNGMAARVPGLEAHAETLRQRALAAGVAAPLLAKALRVECGHDFLIGLLHDVGELALLQRCGEEEIIVPEMLTSPTDGPVIRETLMLDHPRVGGALCRAWRLPTAVAEAAEMHHDYKAGRRSRLPAHLAAASDVISEHVTSAAPTGNPAAHPALAELALPTATLAAILTEVAAKLPTFASMGSTAQPPR
jgi:HD-like signal output (HDOD) protein